MSRRILSLAVALVVAASGVAFSQSDVATLRGAPLAEDAEPPPMRPQIDADLRQVRNYPEQPPVIPHAIDGYQVDLNANKCLTCHARARTGESQAPMVSVTHYMDRDGQFLASVSPRRYFCTQCHVPQHPADTAVDNLFIDIDTLLSRGAGPGAADGR
ncbi:nitrate reductase cytochrome c-type subunit [Aquibium sp. A9E412]|uniref:nitrate reductase cytochrome c-type subunit n=1 Tax=Aquibium sp. A9E412 TaxID=2976767 RepID=UPI0025B2222B|nr:nitrate reductase cytochrome c-type subunit [Aquibium sp. A9E412]MDN2566316.1 nitrate reductase cytochrome c-type subunit [Aquibium sp. A9E412]